MEVSISELAAIKGVSQPAISKRFKRLEAEGLIKARRERGKTLINLAAWDTVTNEVTDPARLIARETAAKIRGKTLDDDGAQRIDGKREPQSSAYTQELTRKAGFEADLKEIEIRKAVGSLLERDAVVQALLDLGEGIVRQLEQLPTHADSVAAAAKNSGVAGVRDELRRIARFQREALHRAMEQFAAGTASEEQEAA